MSEKKSRSLEEIQNEYNRLLHKSGYIQYQLHVAQQDLAVVNAELRDINFEAVRVQAEEASKKEEVQS
jgi:hypothetical protein